MSFRQTKNFNNHDESENWFLIPFTKTLGGRLYHIQQEHICNLFHHLGPCSHFTVSAQISQPDFMKGGKGCNDMTWRDILKIICLGDADITQLFLYSVQGCQFSLHPFCNWIPEVWREEYFLHLKRFFQCWHVMKGNCSCLIYYFYSESLPLALTWFGRGNSSPVILCWNF